MHKIKFHKSFNALQQRIKNDIHYKKCSKRTVILSDKDQSLYLVDDNMQAQFLHNNIINNFTKAKPQIYNNINQEHNTIMAKLNFDENIEEVFTKKIVYIPTKEH